MTAITLLPESDRLSPAAVNRGDKSMLTCHAGGLTRARVRAWLGGNAPGYLSLYQKKNGINALLASNASAADELDYKVPPEVDLVELFVRVVNLDFGGQPQALYLELSQNGEILPIHDADGPINGNDPYRALKLSPDAPHNERKRYHFNVRFS